MPPVKVNFSEVEENEDVFQLQNSPNHHLHLEQTIANNNNNNSRNEENYEPEPEPEPEDEDEEEEEEDGDEKEEEEENKDDVNEHVVDSNALISAEEVGNVLFRLIRSIHLSDDPDEINQNNELGSNGEKIGSELSCDEDDENYKDEFVLVSLSDIRKEVQCPICLGIIRKTRTVMECLHRFCRECIDKSIRMGNKECPACRTHCPSRRSLRDDANFDALIAALFPDIDQYEEEELSFQEDEEARNKQIQASIAQTLQRQTEALSKKRKRSQITYRRRRNYRAEDEVDTHGDDGGKDEHCSEAKSRWSKRRRGQPSPASASGDGGDDEHDQEAHKEVASVGLVGCSEMLAWGKGGLRSNTRYGSGAGGYAKNSRSRLAKLGHHLRNLHENDSEMEIQVVLIPLDQQKPSAVHHSFLCSRPTLSVEQLCQFIAFETSLAPERLEILAARSPSSKSGSFAPVQGQVSSLCALEACIDDLQVLDSEETLAGLKASCNFNQGHLRLAYRQKAST